MNHSKYFPIHRAELDRSDTWLRKNLTEAAVPAFSFVYDGVPSSQSVPGWRRSYDSAAIDEHRTAHTLTFKDPATSLAVRCEAVQNRKFPQLEWTVYIKNEGSADTPVISDLLAIDTPLFNDETEKTGFDGKNIVLRHFNGDHCSVESYAPSVHRFMYTAPLEFHPEGGRPTNKEMPYYRLESVQGGCFFVLSWQGQWSTSFGREGDALRIRGGQQLTRFKLHPGEEIRTPLALLMFYDIGDDDRAINMWRRWYFEFSMPRQNGELIKPFYSNNSFLTTFEMVRSGEKTAIAFADKFLDNGVAFDYLWMDAGWYELHGRNSWAITGTWKVDRERFPNGLRAISDHVHSKGVRTIVWFEPERVCADTELFTEHPDMLLPSEPHDKFKRTKLLNLADPKVVDWISERVNSLIQSEGIDLYRQDFNMDLLDYWRLCDEPDRQGILENHYCSGYLRFWDNIIAANPGIIIDSCASGGRRNDLETLRRALPLHKTDYDYGDHETKQGFHHTLFQWMPFFGSINLPCDQSDKYYHRSAMLMAYHGGDKVFDEDYDFAKLRDWMQEWRETAHLFYGDFHPLTPWSCDRSSWIGWQFNVPETGEGMVQMFMRPESRFAEGSFPLRGLDAGAVYSLKDYDTGEIFDLTGKQLMEDGLKLKMNKRPDSALVRYQKK